MVITMDSKLYFKLPDLGADDPRYGEDGLNINGRTLQDLHENYKNHSYLDKTSQRLIYDSRFMALPTEKPETPFILITDIQEVYGDSNKFFATAIKIGDTASVEGQAKVYTLNWKVTNSEAEKAEEKFILKAFDIVESDYSTEVGIGA